MLQALKVPAALPAGDAIQLSEIIGAMSYALDITEGQPAGHCVRVLLDRDAHRAAGRASAE